MVRKRTQLVGLFPTGTMTALEASEALRECKGDLEAARQYLEKKLRRKNDKSEGKPPTMGDGSYPSTTSKASVLGPELASSKSNTSPQEKNSVAWSNSDNNKMSKPAAVENTATLAISIHETGKEQDKASGLKNKTKKEGNSLLPKFWKRGSETFSDSEDEMVAYSKPAPNHTTVKLDINKGKVDKENDEKAIDTGSGTVNRNFKPSLTKTEVATINHPPKENPTIADEDNRRPPSHSVSINNLSDRQYCCVWWVEVYEDGYRPDIARNLLARVARHVNPILRDRGWRVKRLLESASPRFLGVCHPNGRGDADAASANIQLNLRQQPNKKCQQFRSFAQILSVMLHEITHISIGLEDIHPPAFWELLDEIKEEYKIKLKAGEVEKETEAYGCDKARITVGGEVSTIEECAKLTNLDLTLTLDAGDCGAGRGGQRRRYRGGKKRPAVRALGTQAALKGEKRRPLKKGVKMVDKRTKEGKAMVASLQNSSARDLAARAALARFATSESAPTEEPAQSTTKDDDTIEMLDSGDSEDEETVQEHPRICRCRACSWDKMLCGEIANTIRNWN